MDAACHAPRIAARQAEKYRQPSSHRFGGNADQPFGLLRFQRQRLAGGGGEDQAVDRYVQIAPQQPDEAGLVEQPICERRDQRKPDSLHDALLLGCDAAERKRSGKEKAPSVSGGAL